MYTKDTSILRNLKKVKTKKYEGYYLDDLKDAMGMIMYPQFLKWFHGQTGAIYKGKLVVYDYDVTCFLEGKPVLD
jgi:hypothetical protein